MRTLSGSLAWTVAGALATLGLACTDAPATDLVCATGEIPDGDACVPERCGTGPFGDLASLEAVFAAPAPLGADDGDGSIDAPLDRVDAAVDLAFVAGHRVVALAAGTFQGSVSFGRTGDGARLVGRCSDLTILDGSDSPGATITVHADGVQLTGLTVTGGSPGIAVVPSGEDDPARLAGSDLVLTGNTVAALVVSGTGDVEADLRQSRISFTEPRRAAEDAHAVLAEGAGQIALVDVEIVDNVGFGVAARGTGSGVDLDRVEILGTRAHADGRAGAAVRSAAGGSVTARDLVVEGTTGVGVWATGAGSLVRLTGAELRAMSAAAAGGGEGVLADEGGRVALDSVSVLESRGVGLRADGAGTQLILEDVVVADGIAVDARVGAVAILGTAGATVSGERLRVGAGEGPGIVLHADTEMDCVDCEIEGREFAGVITHPNSTLRLTRGQIRATRASETLGGGVGILVLGHPDERSVLEVVQTAITDHPGPAIQIQGPGTVLFAGASIERSGSGASGLARAGLVARDGTQRWSGTVGDPAAQGLWIRETLFRDLGGDGLVLQAASATLSGNQFEDVGDVEVQTQDCDGVAPPEILGPAPSVGGCEGSPHDIGPQLIYPGP